MDPSNTDADSKRSVRISAVAVAILCFVCMLLGTYVMVATIWVLIQLAHPGAASVPRYWMKSLIRYPLHSTLHTAPTVLFSCIVSTVAWRAICGGTISGRRNVFAFAGLVAVTCWIIRVLAQVVLRGQFIRSPMFDLVFLFACTAIAASIAVLWSRRSATSQSQR